MSANAQEGISLILSSYLVTGSWRPVSLTESSQDDQSSDGNITTSWRTCKTVFSEQRLAEHYQTTSKLAMRHCYLGHCYLGHPAHLNRGNDDHRKNGLREKKKEEEEEYAKCRTRLAVTFYRWLPGIMLTPAKGMLPRTPRYLGHCYLGHRYLGHCYLGHCYLGHRYLGHCYLGHRYLGHFYLGHWTLTTAAESDLWALRIFRSKRARMHIGHLV